MTLKVTTMIMKWICTYCSGARTQQHTNTTTHSNTNTNRYVFTIDECVDTHGNDVKLRVGGHSKSDVENLHEALRILSVTKSYIRRDQLSNPEQIGQGSSGTVYKAKWFDTIDVAVKTLHGFAMRPHEDEDVFAIRRGKMMRNFINELRVLEACRHTNVIAVLGVCVGLFVG